jgi:hypothetical protein
MRILHAISPDERLVSWGRYRYLADGAPTGDVESWQVTRLPDGVEIVRVDLDGEQARGARLVAHLQRGPDGRPEWLRMRYRRDDVNAAAHYTFEEAVVHVARVEASSGRRLGEVEIATGYVVDYHAVIAYDYVWRGYPPDAEREPRRVAVFTPDLWAEGDGVLRGRALRFDVKPLPLEPCDTPAGMFPQALPFSLRYEDGTTARIWYDRRGTPLRMLFPQGKLEAVLANYQTGPTEGAGQR